ncbi:hypothetical protein ACFX2F_033723 [Malus domestica]
MPTLQLDNQTPPDADTVLRKNPITSSISSSLTTVSGPKVTVKIVFFFCFYYVDVYVRNPPVKTKLAIDTGSSPVWIQTAQCA